MTQKNIVLFLSSIVAAAGAVLAVGDTITALPLPPYVVNAWPLVLAASTLIHRIGMAVIEANKPRP